MRAQSWKKLAWEGIETEGMKAVRERLREERLVSRIVRPQENPSFHRFIDDTATWPVLDDRTKQPGLPWRSRLNRDRPSADIHPGLRPWDSRELFRDVPTPANVAQVLANPLKVGVFESKSDSPEKLIGALVYDTNGALEGSQSGIFQLVATAPSHRSRSIATLLVLGMLEHMRLEGCESCHAMVPPSDVLTRPWLLQWLELLDFETADATREGTAILNTAAFGTESFVADKLAD
ncbi:hypothetical protein DIPPA_33154 [Diplonema papillatum]|nr:hypothetical protein DIPPA_33154 [Diplonema papillatum]